MYEWDEGKRAANRFKHGVDLSLAEGFDWSIVTLEEDARTDYGETRWIATGPIGERLYVLVYTRRGAITRVIDLRKANRREVKAYAKRKA